MHKPTTEQQAIISLAKTKVNFAVEALAGTGKTTSFLMVSKAIAEKDSFDDWNQQLYVSFNKAIADEATTKFNSNYVTCKTAHSLAWGEICRGTKYNKRLTKFGYSDRELSQNLKGISEEYFPQYYSFFKEDMKEDDCEWKMQSELLDIIQKWNQSAYHDLEMFCLDYITPDNGFIKETYPMLAQIVSSYWKEILNPKSDFKITHDYYLKLWQLSKPDLSQYKTIFLDECQDINPVISEIFLRQKCQLVFVGDSYQSIYEWRGAKNTFDLLPESYLGNYLSTSFRFPQHIADTANRILNRLGCPVTLIGKGEKKEIENRATIVRNNSTLFLILLQAADLGQKVKAEIDTKDLWSLMYTAAALFYRKKGEKPNFPKYPHKLILQYSSWQEMERDKSPEIQKIVNLVKITSQVTWEEFTGVGAAIRKAQSVLVSSGEDFTVITGHKSKGKEWDEVSLTDDFLPVQKEGETWDECLERFQENQGFNLLYVAVTRARVKLNLSEAMEEFIYDRI